MDEAKGAAETKGELSRENVHDILQGMQDLRGWPAVVLAERVAPTHTGQRPQRQLVWRFGVRRRPGRNQEDKRKRQGREHRECIYAAFD